MSNASPRQQPLRTCSNAIRMFNRHGIMFQEEVDDAVSQGKWTALRTVILSTGLGAAS
jgi:hypothetical protein